MAEGRMLKKVISTSKKLAQVSDRAKVIWFMLLPHTDVEGRCNACPDIVKGQYLTLLNYPKNSIQKCLIELHNVGLIILYQVDDNQFAEFARFKDFQQLRPNREGESTIPPPNSHAIPVVLPEYSGQSEVKLSKVKLINNYCANVFDFWNEQGKLGKWKSHRKMTPDIQKAIATALNEYSPEEVIEAIGNFRLVLHGQDYLWTYDGWGLREFLTRRDKDDRSTCQWLRFHPNTFRESDWLTPAAKQRRITAQRTQQDQQQKSQQYIEENKAWIMEAEPAALLKRAQSDPRLYRAIEQLRPEILDKGANHE
jgi:hypothetical protein